MVHLVKHDRLNGFKKLTTADAANRHGLVMASNLIDCDVLKSSFNEDYDDSMQNRGNREAHHAATNAEIEESNRRLEALAETGDGDPFWVQIKTEDGANRAGENFVEPAAGTVMTLRLEDRGETISSFHVQGIDQTIKYKTNPPAQFLPGLVYSSLDKRFRKKDNRANNTNATKATLFTVDELCVPKYRNCQNRLAAMINLRPDGYTKVPEHNVILCWIEKKDVKAQAKSKTNSEGKSKGGKSKKKAKKGGGKKSGKK